MSYLKLKSINPFRSKYIFIDNKRLYSQEMFDINRIRIKYIQSFTNSKFNNFKVIMCSVNKKDENNFLYCLKELDKKLQILFNVEYDEICKDINNMFKGE